MHSMKGEIRMAYGNSPVKTIAKKQRSDIMKLAENRCFVAVFSAKMRVLMTSLAGNEGF